MVFNIDIITITAGYKYLDFKVDESSKHWINVGIYVNFKRSFKIPEIYKIQWIEKLL